MCFWWIRRTEVGSVVLRCVLAWGVHLNRQCRPVCVFVCLCVCWAQMHSKEHVWVWWTLARQTSLHSTHAKKTRTFQPLLALGRYAFVYFGDPLLFKTYFRNHKLIFKPLKPLAWGHSYPGRERFPFSDRLHCENCSLNKVALMCPQGFWVTTQRLG